ncbi:MAG TPA: hypothetical protein VNA69_01985 [Thermoanaerobaculia bacterium]|nr:hypothetical protein [Thermoanaerobaculia bacterium]
MIATADFRERLEDIDDRIRRNDVLLANTMNDVKNRSHVDVEYARWANGFGHFALSTLYITVVYFACASKIRADLPFVNLSSGDDRRLLDLLSKVRQAVGGEFGIWENLQDSFGSYVRRDDGSIMNYRHFCSLIGDEVTCPWFLRLIDFYRDLDRKLQEERQQMIRELRALEAFLSAR